MKNKSPVKAVAGNQTAKSPIVKAKNVSPQKKNGSPKQQNGKVNKMQNSSKKKQKEQKQNKVPVMNETTDNDDSDSASSNIKVAKFAGTAALGDASIDNVPKKKGKKNKKVPKLLGDGDDTEIPAKRLKQKESPKKELKADGMKKRIKKFNSKKRKIGLVHTLAKHLQDKEFKELERLLPNVMAEIRNITAAKSESSSARRKLRILQSYEKKIRSGNYDPASSQTSTKVKNMPRVPTEVQKMKLDSDDKVTLQDMLANIGSDDEAENVDEEEEDNENDEVEKKPVSKAKQGKKLAAVQKAEDKVSGKGQKKAVKKSRFVLFVGNLSFETKEDEIKAHFEKVGNAISVRLGKHKDGKSKGFCHIEFDTEEAYQKALSMHHTQLNKRQINVSVSNNGNQKSPPGNKKKNAKVKDMKLKGMKSRGLLAGSRKDSSKRSVRRKKAAKSNE